MSKKVGNFNKSKKLFLASTILISGAVVQVDLVNAEETVKPPGYENYEGLETVPKPEYMTINKSGEHISFIALKGLAYEIRNMDTNEVLGSGVLLDDDGRELYTETSILVPMQENLIGGELLRITVTDRITGASSYIEVIFSGMIVPETPTDIKVSKNGLMLSGKANPKDFIYIYNGEGTAILRAKIEPDENGVFEVDLPGHVINKNVIVQAINTSNNASDYIIVPVKSYRDTYQKFNSNSLLGESDSEHYISVEDSKGVVIAEPIKVSENGTFEVNLPDSLVDEEILYVYTKDSEGNVIYTEEIVYDKPQEMTLDSTGTIITGRKEVGHTLVVKNSSGEILPYDYTLENGTDYELTLKTPVGLGETITVFEMSSEGVELNQTQLTMPEKVKPPGYENYEGLDVVPKPINRTVLKDGYSLDIYSIKGLAYEVKNLDKNTVLAEGIFDENSGRELYKETQANIKLSERLYGGELIRVTVTDRITGASAYTDFIFAGSVVPKPVSEIVLSKQGLVLSGKIHPTDRFYIFSEDGRERIMENVKPDENGRFTVTLPEHVKDSYVRLVNMNTSNNPSKIVNVYITEYIDTYQKFNSNSLLGESDSEHYISVEDSKGVVIAEPIKVSEDRTFEINLPDNLIDKKILYVYTKDSEGFVIHKETIVYDKPQEMTLDSTGTIITGQKEVEHTLVVKNSSGEILPYDYTLEDDTYYELTLKTPVGSGETITVFEMSSEGVELKQTQLTMPIAPEIEETMTLEQLLLEILNALSEQKDSLLEANENSTNDIIAKLDELKDSVGSINNNDLLQKLTELESSLTSTINNLEIDNTDVLQDLQDIKDLISNLSDENILAQIKVLENLLNSGNLNNNEELSAKLDELIASISSNSGTTNTELLNKIKDLENLLNSGFDGVNTNTNDKLAELEEAIAELTDKNILAQIASLETLIKDLNNGTSNTELELGIVKLIELLEGDLNVSVDNSDIISLIEALSKTISENKLEVDNTDVLNKLEELLTSLNKLEEEVKNLASLPSDKENGYTLEELREVIEEVLNGADLSLEIIKYLELSKDKISNEELLAELSEIFNIWEQKLTAEAQTILEEIKNGNTITNDLIKELETKLEFITDENLKADIEEIINAWKDSQNNGDVDTENPSDVDNGDTDTENPSDTENGDVDTENPSDVDNGDTDTENPSDVDNGDTDKDNDTNITTTPNVDNNVVYIPSTNTKPVGNTHVGGKDLPQTGSESSTGMATGGILAMLAGLMAFVKFRRKDKKETE